MRGAALPNDTSAATEAEGASFSMDRHSDGPLHTLMLAGELDYASAPTLERTVRRLCERGAERLVLDLSELEFIDSAGLNAILRARALCDEHLCGLEITALPHRVSRIFELTRLLDRLPFRRSEQPEAA
jgi:anti-anti-sigma factor